MNLAVRPVAGEPTRFLVEGDTISCTKPGCKYRTRRVSASSARFNKSQKNFLFLIGFWPKVESALEKINAAAVLKRGMTCPKCKSMTEVREVLVDLADYKGNGSCGCESFQFTCQPDLEKSVLTPSPLRCPHIETARDFALDMAVRLQSKEKSSVVSDCKPKHSALW